MIVSSFDFFSSKVFGNDGYDIAMTSMPGDPIHPGHISMLQSMSHSVLSYYSKNNLACHPFVTVCVVNNDKFLQNKKGFSFMPLQDRLEVIDSIKNGADYVVPFCPTNPNDQTVCEAIEALKPKFFLKGGDRTADSTLPEWGICQKLGCTIIDHVGANKKWSSSNYLANYRKFVIAGIA